MSISRLRSVKNQPFRLMDVDPPQNKKMKVAQKQTQLALSKGDGNTVVS